MNYLLKYFSADGNYEVTLMTKATVYFDGRVIWEVRLKKNIFFVFFNDLFDFLATGNLQIQLYHRCGIFSIRFVYFDMNRYLYGMKMIFI
jgi:hypothetical protein